ncbi:hypothetical protein ABW19_dt0210352 [Dactylella cylindrospora]|nr:hypothetical protein ABW19_dt0210352 [Dactylella cylindrospora]
MAHIIITGATGLAGSFVLQYALSSPAISKVSILSRRPVSAAEGNPKANVIIHKDFNSYPPEVLSQLSGAVGVVWAQGISSVGMKEDDYRVITKDYPLAAAEAFATLKQPEGKKLNFVYTSGRGADQNMKASQMFGRVKGDAEKCLLKLGESKGFTVYNVRPAAIDPVNVEWPSDRKKTWADRMFKVVGPVLRPVAPGLFTPVEKLGEVMVKLAIGDGEKIQGPGVLADGYTLENEALRVLGGW